MSATRTDDAVRDHCHAAVAALDRVIDERPAEEHEYLVEAVRCLNRLRDRMIERRRAGDTSRHLRDRLDRINAILSVVVGGQYPLVGVRWERVQHARDTLRQLLEDTA
ncbi:MAG TPA: hypothetical protein VFG43_00195 [Geminicoccaceae bacterium]|nr:hypothetical protein [Geminicoccaceae bacterium]